MLVEVWFDEGDIAEGCHIPEKEEWCYPGDLYEVPDALALQWTEAQRSWDNTLTQIRGYVGSHKSQEELSLDRRPGQEAEDACQS